MPDATEAHQKFMIKLPTKLHRELMGYAGVKNEALSDILVKWIEEIWASKPEREVIVSMMDKVKNPAPAARPTKEKTEAPKTKAPEKGASKSR